MRSGSGSGSGSAPSQLSLSFAYFVHGESTICATIGVRSHSRRVRRLATADLPLATHLAALAAAATTASSAPNPNLNPNLNLNPNATPDADADVGGLPVALAPFALAARLVAPVADADGASAALLDKWARLFPAAAAPVDAALPKLVEVECAGRRLLYPAALVLVVQDAAFADSLRRLHIDPALLAATLSPAASPHASPSKAPDAFAVASPYCSQFACPRRSFDSVVAKVFTRVCRRPRAKSRALLFAAPKAEPGQVQVKLEPCAPASTVSSSSSATSTTSASYCASDAFEPVAAKRARLECACAGGSFHQRVGPAAAAAATGARAHWRAEETANADEFPPDDTQQVASCAALRPTVPTSAAAAATTAAAFSEQLVPGLSVGVGFGSPSAAAPPPARTYSEVGVQCELSNTPAAAAALPSASRSLVCPAAVCPSRPHLPRGPIDCDEEPTTSWQHYFSNSNEHVGSSNQLKSLVATSSASASASAPPAALQQSSQMYARVE